MIGEERFEEGREPVVQGMQGREEVVWEAAGGGGGGEERSDEVEARDLAGETCVAGEC